MTTVRFDPVAGRLVLLDQTALPRRVSYVSPATAEEVRDAIRTLTVRGAPAIGVAAAYGLYLGVRGTEGLGSAAREARFEEARALLEASRPTAVNLSWALARMARRWAAGASHPAADRIASLLREADAIRDEDEEVCRRIGENGLELLGRGWGLLTHCNAGALATSRYGTALAPIYRGTEKGYRFRVYADETRPLLQGARLTAWELAEAGVDVTLICDNMASLVMREGRVQAVLVGCDRVAANGDTANKIGTSGVAILARHYGIPFYVHAPLSTIDIACPDGAGIPIEQRAPEEITEMWYAHRMAPDGVKAFNPAFDVTDAGLITAIVTERGILRPPYGPAIADIVR